MLSEAIVLEYWPVYLLITPSTTQIAGVLDGPTGAFFRVADHPGGADRCWIANGTSHVGDLSLLWLPIDDLTA
jgi:hypothetical protein